MPGCKALVGKKECGKPVLGTSDYCNKHGGKVATTVKVAYSVLLKPPSGETKPNPAFAQLAASTVHTHPYKLRIEKIRDDGPIKGGKENVHGVMLNHDTQPSNNVTVWFEWLGNTLIIYGLGNHRGKGNKHYEMLWYDGSSKTWSRPG